MFGSQRPHVLDDPVKKERRSWNRVPVQVGVFCQNVQGEDELCWSARVVDISRAGMKLLSPHRFDPNTTIRIGKADGMQLFNDSLKYFIDKELISRSDAFEISPNIEELKMALKGIDVRSAGIL